jgi:hypothetical protein
MSKEVLFEDSETPLVDILLAEEGSQIDRFNTRRDQSFLSNSSGSPAFDSLATLQSMILQEAGFLEHIGGGGLKCKSGPSWDGIAVFQGKYIHPLQPYCVGNPKV